MISRRTVLPIVVLLLAVTYVFAGGVGLTTTDNPADGVSTVRDSQLIQPTDNGSYLWPYTSRSESVQGRTLAINMLIYGPPEKTRTALTDASTLEWVPVNESEQDATPESYNVSIEDGVDWDDAAGSTRYTYIDRRPHGGDREWVDVSYQLHTGSYLGSRHHIRAYSSTTDNWTAVQVHREYFDWFRLRHTVTDIHDSSRVIEADFIDQPFVEEVSRNYYGHRGGWNDGWLTSIQLAFGLFLSTVIATDTRRALLRLGRDVGQWAVINRYGFVLAGTLTGLLLGIRVAGIGLETLLPTQSPQLLAGLLYPVIVFGPPTLVVVFAPRLRPLGAFVFTVVGLGAGFVYDFAAIGLGVVPIQVVLHRFGLLVALGLLAVTVVNSHNSEQFGPDGAADRPDPPLIVITGLAWLAGLALPLFGYL